MNDLSRPTMMARTKFLVEGLLLLAMAVVAPARCWAIDYQPFDWVPLQPGTYTTLGYFEHGKSTEYNNTLTGTTDARLDSDLGLFRFVHYATSTLFGHAWDYNLLIPFGQVHNVSVGGVPLGHASGIADPIVSAGTWLINEPSHLRWFSVADYVTIPIGSYDRGKPVNLGANRWQSDLQLNFTQGFAKRWVIDLSAGWIHYWNNTQSGSTGRQTLKQDGSYEMYGWLSYNVAAASQSYVSLGYANTFGGEVRLDGVETGAKTERGQLRLSAMAFIAPEWQVLISMSHDVHVVGDFKQDYGMMLRIAKIFPVEKRKHR